MHRRLLRWLHVTLRPEWVALAFAGYATIEVFYCWIQWKFGFQPALEIVLRIRDGYMFFVAACYGAARVMGFHPLIQLDYRRWLMSVPWNWRKALPLGPVHLVIQDGVVLAVLALMMRDPRCDPLYLPITFLFTYLVYLSLSFWVTGAAGMGFVLAYGLGLVVWLFPIVPLQLAALAALYVAGYVGLRRSLAQFPWRLGPNSDALSMWELIPMKWRLASRTPALGWPYNRLEPNPPDHAIGYWDSILVSVLAGWWIFAVLSHFSDLINDAQARLGLLAFLANIAIIMVSVRLGIYCLGYQDPISFWGRLRTGRWIIPGHDRVLAGPICAVLIGGAWWALFHALKWKTEIACSVSMTFVLLTVLTSAPTYKRWILTGNHRIVPGIVKGKDFEEI